MAKRSVAKRVERKVIPFPVWDRSKLTIDSEEDMVAFMIDA